MSKKILATRELSVNINGQIYDVLLIPREQFVDVDYSNAPELDPNYKPEDGEDPKEGR